MKRKILIFLTIALLVCSLAFSVSAEYASHPLLSKVTAEKPYMTVILGLSGSDYTALGFITSQQYYASSSYSGAIVMPEGTSYDIYEYWNGTWTYDQTVEYNTDTMHRWNGKSLLTNYDLCFKSGSVYHASDYSLCDGSTCPATDANLDNICDDCGKVLTMSLRNPLLDYARSLAQGKAPEYPYYAIFLWNDSYTVHISKNPMSSPDGVVLTGDGIMYNRVSQSADGVNGGSGWYNGFYETYDSFVESNHDISNFKEALPMAEAILGVTEEQMEETLPELGRTMMIILLCGVGCLALLILSSLLVKVFGRFRQG